MFISPRPATEVDVLFRNKNFVFEKTSTQTKLPASSFRSITKKANWDSSRISLLKPSSSSLFASTKFKEHFDHQVKTAATTSVSATFGLPVSNFSITNYNDYDPIDVIQLPEHKQESPRPLFMQVVSNHYDFVNNFQIILVAFETHVEIYSLESAEAEDNHENLKEDMGKSSLKFSVKKLQECSDIRPYGVQIQGCALSHLSCVSSENKSLVYAIAILGSETFFLVREEGVHLTKDIDICKNQDLVAEIVCLNRCAVTHLAFNYPQGCNREEFLAVLDDGRVCNVLDINNELCFAAFSLKSPGIFIGFHPSEHYKLMVVEMSGLITIFNVAKQCAVQSINMCTRLLSAHWCLANPLIVAVGGVEESFILDLSKPYTTAASKIPFKGKTIQKIEFSEVDPSMIVFLGQPGIEVKVFRTHEKIHKWAKTDKKISDAAWLVGMPYLLVLSRDHFHIYL